jgi:transcription factor E2F3
MNESQGESQKWSNSPGYTNATNSPFKTPLSAKEGRTHKSRVSKEGRSCPQTPISNAGQKISHYLPVDPSSLFPHLKSFSAWKHLMLKL